MSEEDEMSRWTWNYPTEPGWYWFWGTAWGDHIDFDLVRVHRIINGLAYVMGAAFIYPHHRGGAYGAWCPAVVPEDPSNTGQVVRQKGDSDEVQG